VRARRPRGLARAVYCGNSRRRARRLVRLKVFPYWTSRVSQSIRLSKGLRHCRPFRRRPGKSRSRPAAGVSDRTKKILGARSSSSGARSRGALHARPARAHQRQTTVDSVARARASVARDLQALPRHLDTSRPCITCGRFSEAPTSRRCGSLRRTSAAIPRRWPITCQRQRGHLQTAQLGLDPGAGRRGADDEPGLPDEGCSTPGSSRVRREGIR